MIIYSYTHTHGNKPAHYSLLIYAWHYMIGVNIKVILKDQLYSCQFAHAAWPCAATAYTIHAALFQHAYIISLIISLFVMG